MTKETQLRKYLKQIIQEQPASLEAEVSKEALDHENIASFFHDLLRNGCASGIVSGLIYYYDTHRFYDSHYQEIESLRYDLEEAFGEPLCPKGDLKNWYAWLAFEETARAIADQFGIDW